MRTLAFFSALILASCSSTPADDAGAGGGAAGGVATGGGTGGGASGGGTGAGGGTADAGLAPGEYTRTLTAYPNRSFDLIIPAADGGVHPAVFLIHGGGGNRNAARRTSCPNGVTTSPQCFDALATARGFIVIIPDGTGALLRTWNSGGGSNGWQCVSGPACTSMVDEQAYFTAVLSEVASLTPVDLTRIYATGLSNGGSMSERLACQFSEVSAIASVGSGNQWSTTNACTRSASVLEIHGTADPCWNWDGGPASCADSNPGSKISVADTLAVWIRNNGCDGGVTISAIPDTSNDGTSTVRHVYSCSGDALELYEVIDGGHTWPGGAISGNGVTAQDWFANEVILDFFSTH